jgi:hypothetical protein
MLPETPGEGVSRARTETCGVTHLACLVGVSARIEMSMLVLLRAVKLGFFLVWKQIQARISDRVTKQGVGAWANALSLGLAFTIRTDHHKSSLPSQFSSNFKAAETFENFSLVDQPSIASPTRWRRASIRRPIRSRVVLTRPLACAFDLRFLFFNCSLCLTVFKFT